jgi:hypothetical protein
MFFFFFVVFIYCIYFCVSVLFLPFVLIFVYAEKAEKLLFSTCERFSKLCHTLKLHVQHNKPLQSRLESAVSMCAMSAF